MRYIITFADNQQLCTNSDVAFDGFIQIAVRHNKDIMSFHVKVYADTVPLYRVQFDKHLYFLTKEDLVKFIENESKEHPDVRITRV